MNDQFAGANTAAARAGHIPSAVSIPGIKVFEQMDWGSDMSLPIVAPVDESPAAQPHSK